MIVENRRTGVTQGTRLSLQVGGVWNVADYRQVQSTTTENEEGENHHSEGQQMQEEQAHQFFRNLISN